MKNRIPVLAVIVSTIVAFTACSAYQEETQTATSAKETTRPLEARETQAKEIEKKEAVQLPPSELYPAFVMEGSEKKWGYIDEKGKFSIKPQYGSASDFRSGGVAEVLINGRYGLIDKMGNWIASPQYSYSSNFSDKAIVMTDDAGKSCLLDETGRILFRTDGSIGKLSGDMAPFSSKFEKGQLLYGYIDDKGKVVIEPQFISAQGFSKGKAVVEISNGHFGIIDKEGKLLKEISNNRITGLSEDVFVFSKVDGNNGARYGYMTMDGKVILEAVYTQAQAFEDGLAIVNMAKDYTNAFGVINKNGEFVIPAKYGWITSLGNGIYAVPIAQDDNFSSYFSRKALFDKTGRQLTEFMYYDVERMENGLISATDDKNTYLLDNKGNEIGSLLKAEGIGSIRPCGKLYKVEADNEIYYLTHEGKTIWKSDHTVRFEDGLEVRMITFRPDRCMLIQYPEVSGLPDLKVQEKINRMLKEQFVGNNKASSKNGDMYAETTDINYHVDRNKDLLIIGMSGYFYPIGAAHGQPYRKDYHINIKTGSVYSLKDLFKNDSGYKEKMTEIIKQKIVKANNESGDQIYSLDMGDWEEGSEFRIEKDALQIYFYPYAIAAYALGFPEFYIRYDEIMGLINTEGEFWRSFDRDLSAKSEKPAYEITQDEKAKIEEAIKNYENTIVEAINKNDFALVEPWLYSESSLYHSQKKLVADLNRQQIKERLEGFSVEKVEVNSTGMVFRAYVTENIAIEYPGKDYTTKQFNWVYSLRYDYESGKYQLTYMDNP